MSPDDVMLLARNEIEPLAGNDLFETAVAMTSLRRRAEQWLDAPHGSDRYFMGIDLMLVLDAFEAALAMISGSPLPEKKQP